MLITNLWEGECHIKQSLCIETIFTEAPFEERFAMARAAGFEYVEFWSWQDKDVKEIKKLCEQNELKVASFSGDQHYSLIDKSHLEDYIQFIEASLDTAKYLNCQHLVIHSNALGEMGIVLNHYKELSNFEKFGTMLKILQALKPIAEQANITLVLEALNTKVDHEGNFLASTKMAAEAIRWVGSKRIKVLYDVYHMQIMEGNLIQTLNQYFDAIDYVHIADVPGRHEPGTGEINFTAVIETLRSLKYKGIIGFELFPENDSQKAVNAIRSLV